MCWSTTSPSSWQGRNPTNDHHAITLPSMTMINSKPCRIPLKFQGVTSYFPTQSPIREEHESTPDEWRIELTAETPDWDLSTTQFQEQEDAMLNSNGTLRDSPDGWTMSRTIAALHTLPQSETPFYQLGEAMTSAVMIDANDSESRRRRKTGVGSLISGKHKCAIDPKNWETRLEMVARTVNQ